MSIKDLGGKIKGQGKVLLDRLRGAETSRYYTAAFIILVGLSSFGLGRLSILDERREPVIIEQETLETASQSASVVKSIVKPASTPSATTNQMEGGKLVASKNGTK